jgi:hypothetical protein
MRTEPVVALEQHLEEVGGPTIGWLARYGDGRAIWCGEFSRAAFQRQPPEVREALRDDFGWFLVDYCTAVSPTSAMTVLGKAAGERPALELMKLIVLGRLMASVEPGGDQPSHRIFDAIEPRPIVGKSPAIEIFQ